MTLRVTPVYANDVEVSTARLEASDEGYRMVAAFSFELSKGLEEAITRGIPMHFTTEVELTRPRLYWFDEKPYARLRPSKLPTISGPANIPLPSMAAYNKIFLRWKKHWHWYFGHAAG